MLTCFSRQQFRQQLLHSGFHKDLLEIFFKKKVRNYMILYCLSASLSLYLDVAVSLCLCVSLSLYPSVSVTSLIRRLK